MTSLALVAFALITNGSARAADTAEVAELKRRVTALTAEAEALWVYVESGPDTPNVSAINRAMNLYDKRRKWSKK